MRFSVYYSEKRTEKDKANEKLRKRERERERGKMRVVRKTGKKAHANKCLIK